MMYLAIAAIGVLAMVLKPSTSKSEIDEWTRFDDLFKAAGIKYHIPWTWLKAIALNESDLGRADSVAIGLENPLDVVNSKSSDGLSWGLMQVTIRTARGIDSNATEIKLNDPKYSIDLAARYIKQLLALFDNNENNVEWIIKSYNQGPGNTRKEIATGFGYAQKYWERFQRNLKQVETKI